jgi:hypothetical protein
LMYCHRCCFFPGFPALAKVSAVAAFPTAVEFSTATGLQRSWVVYSNFQSSLCCPWTMETHSTAVCAFPTCLLYNKLSASGRVCSGAACAIPGLPCSVYQPLAISIVN